MQENWRSPTEPADDLWAVAREGDGFVLAIHGDSVVVGIPFGTGGAMVHLPAAVARDIAMSLWRSADLSEERGSCAMN